MSSSPSQLKLASSSFTLFDHLVPTLLFTIFIIISVNPSVGASNATNNIVIDISPFIIVYKNGTKLRPIQTPYTPPSLHDPLTGISSKDTIISHIPSISARLYLPNSNLSHKKLPVFVYFHGGGFLIESAFSKQYHHFLNNFVSQVNVVAVSVEYRLAPEHPLPAAYHDCWEALKWVASHYSISINSGRDPWLANHADLSKIFISGDSAGANIVHYLAMRAGAEDLPHDVKILGAILACPYFYGSKPVGSEPAVNHAHSLFKRIWDCAYPNATGGIDNPLINPLAPGAPSLAALSCSKILVCVAGNDALRDRGVWYYQGVINSGWKGKLQLFEQPGEGHVYHVINPETEHAQKLIKLMDSFIVQWE